MDAKPLVFPRPNTRRSFSVRDHLVQVAGVELALHWAVVEPVAMQQRRGAKTAARAAVEPVAEQGAAELQPREIKRVWKSRPKAAIANAKSSNWRYGYACSFSNPSP